MRRKQFSPVVVDRVEDGVALNLGRTTRGVVDVVALESDHIVATSEVKSPVVASITSGRPVGRSIDVAVGNCDSAGSRLSENDVLAGNALSLVKKSTIVRAGGTGDLQ